MWSKLFLLETKGIRCVIDFHNLYGFLMILQIFYIELLFHLNEMKIL